MGESAPNPGSGSPRKAGGESTVAPDHSGKRGQGSARSGLELYLVRTPQGVRPADDASRESMRTWALGEVVKCVVKRPRNLGHHRKAFALLEVMREADRRDPPPPMRAFLKEVKVKLGLFELMLLPDGRSVLDVESIAFDAMSQDRFERDVWSPLLDLALQDYLPDTDRATLELEVMRRLEFAT